MTFLLPSQTHVHTRTQAARDVIVIKQIRGHEALYPEGFYVFMQQQRKPTTDKQWLSLVRLYIPKPHVCLKGPSDNGPLCSVVTTVLLLLIEAVALPHCL